MTAAAQALLEVVGLRAGYGKRDVLHDVSFGLGRGEILLVLGHNGAGKTTLLRAVFGLLRPTGGAVRFAGADITGRAPRFNVGGGVALVPQGHGVFPHLSIAQNLRLGAFTVRDPALVEKRQQAAVALFPILAERRQQAAGTLSGGQQQMLAIAMALMTSPQLLLLDEPSIGLAPALVGTLMESITRINREFGTTVMLIEQNVTRTLPIASRAVVLRGGRKVYDGGPAALADHTFLMSLF